MHACMHSVHVHIPDLVVRTLALMYLYSPYFKAIVCTTWIHGPRGCSLKTVLEGKDFSRCIEPCRRPTNTNALKPTKPYSLNPKTRSSSTVTMEIPGATGMCFYEA